MGRGSTATRREADLVRRCYAGLDGPAFQAEVVRSLHALLTVDAIFFATADPATLLFTGALAEDPLAAATGNGCRRSLTVPYCQETMSAAPGVVVLHPDLTVAAITAEAERWLGHIAGHRPDPGRLPVPVYAVAARLQSIDNATARSGVAPTVRVPSTTGGWLLIHASHLNSPAGGDIAVIIEPAHPSTVAPLLLAAWRLTQRERDVALLVLRGASTEAIGAELHLSAYTVKDYLKSIFDKIGVRSRRDLVAHVLTSQRSAPSAHASPGHPSGKS